MSSELRLSAGSARVVSRSAIAGVLAAGAFVTSASAQLLTSETFTGYTAGPAFGLAEELAGQGTAGGGWSGAWQNQGAGDPGSPGDQYVVSNETPLNGGGNYGFGGGAYTGATRSLDDSAGGYFGSQGLTQDVGGGNHRIGVDNGKDWVFSADIRIDTLQNGQNYWLGLGYNMFDGGGVNETNLKFAFGVTGGVFALVSNGSTASSAVSVTQGTVYTVSVVADFTGGTAANLSLYLNEADPLAPTGSAIATLATANATFEQLGWLGSSGRRMSVDNIHIAQAIPEPSTVAGVFGGLALAVAGVARRMRRS